MAKIKCPKQDLFTLLTVKAYNLENEFNLEIDNQTLIKNQIIKKSFILERIRKNWRYAIK
jgi:hypothetical protein